MISSIYHRSQKPWVYSGRENRVSVTIRVEKNSVESIELIYGDPMGGWKGKIWNNHCHKMKYIAESNEHEMWSGEMSVGAKRYRYAFKIYPKIGKPFIYGEDGKLNEMSDISEYAKGFTYSYWSKNDLLNTSSWFRQTSWYQIFPDRFKQLSSLENKNWSKLPKQHEIYGGNIKGIIDRIDHIKNLGFNGIYLTPIFKAKTSHRYDTNDYYKIDHILGTEEDFKQLIIKAHSVGMKIMIDGVFNHIGHHSMQFQDVIKNKSQSKYKDWFWINDYSNLKQASEYCAGEFEEKYPYETFATTPHMPRINWWNKEVREHILKSVEKWTKFGIDGWRLDVSFEPPISFWREFNKRVRKINPEAVIIGEVWWDSIDYIENDIWDGVMNYPLRRIILDYVSSNDTAKDRINFIQSYNSLSFKYTPEQQWGMFNLMSSHDVARLITLLNNDVAKFKLAMEICFMQPGSPSTYYGQEVGLNGGEDPDNRRPYPWDDESIKYFNFFKKLNTDRINFVNTSDIFDRYVAKLKGSNVILTNGKNTFEIRDGKLKKESNEKNN